MLLANLRYAFAPAHRRRGLQKHFARYFQRCARMPETRDDFNRWAQSLPPEDAAKLHYLLSAPEVPTDTSSGSGSP